MSKREQLISKVTSYVRGLSKRREDNRVTADDVQTYLTKNKFRGNVNERLSVVRSVLRAPTFTRVGSQASERDAARGRMITAWSATN